MERAKQGNFMDRMTFALFYATDFADRLENQIIPALKSGHIVIADRYVYTAFARDIVRDPDQAWIRDLYGFAIVPDLVLYLKMDIETLVERVVESGGINYREAGLDLHMGQDLFDSFVNYQSNLIAQYDKLAKEFGFTVVDATCGVEDIQALIQKAVTAILEKPDAESVKAKEETPGAELTGDERLETGDQRPEARKRKGE